MLGVGDGVANDVLEEDLENATSLLIDETRDTLHTTTTCETTDSWLGDTLDVVTKNLAMTLSATLAETLRNKKEGVSTSVVVVSCTSAYLATLSTARHCLISGC